MLYYLSRNATSGGRPAPLWSPMWLIAIKSGMPLHNSGRWLQVLMEVVRASFLGYATIHTKDQYFVLTTRCFASRSRALRHVSSNNTKYAWCGVPGEFGSGSVSVIRLGTTESSYRGVFVVKRLYGVTCVQIFMYFQKYSRDPLPLRITVCMFELLFMTCLTRRERLFSCGTHNGPMMAGLFDDPS